MFLNLRGAAEGALIRAAASTKQVGRLRLFISMSNNETTPNLPEHLLLALQDARTAIAQQKYGEALSVLQEGLDGQYEATTIDSLELLKYFRGLLFILEFNLQQAKGAEWSKKLKTAPDNKTKCLFCGRTYADVAKLISGPEGIICNECVEICNELLAER